MDKTSDYSVRCWTERSRNLDTSEEGVAEEKLLKKKNVRLTHGEAVQELKSSLAAERVTFSEEVADMAEARIEKV